MRERVSKREKAQQLRERERHEEKQRCKLTLIISLVSVLDSKIIALDIQLNKRKDELLFDELPDDSACN